VTGHPVVVYTDNKALSFFKKCQLASSIVARWVMQLQEFDLTIEHIKGTNNFFADILSRNPVGINKEMNQVRGQHEFLVAKINLDIDKLLVKGLRNIPFHQNSDINDDALHCNAYEKRKVCDACCKTSKVSIWITTRRWII
jgi:hypothetical protein